MSLDASSGHRPSFSTPTFSVTEASPTSTNSGIPSFNNTERAFSFQNPNHYNFPNTSDNKQNYDIQHTSDMQQDPPFRHDEDMDLMRDDQHHTDEDFDIDLDLDAGDGNDKRYNDGDIDLDLENPFDDANLAVGEEDLQMGSTPAEQDDDMLDDIAEPQQEDIELHDDIHVSSNQGFSSHIQTSFAAQTTQTVQTTPLSAVSTGSNVQFPLASAHSTPRNSVSAASQPIFNTTPRNSISVPSQPSFDSTPRASFSTASQPVFNIPSPARESQPVAAHLSVSEAATVAPSQLDTSSTQEIETIPETQAQPKTPPTTQTPTLTQSTPTNAVRISQADTVQLENTPVQALKEWSETTSATLAADSPAETDKDEHSLPEEDFDERPQEGGHRDEAESNEHVPTDISSLDENFHVVEPDVQNAEDDEVTENDENAAPIGAPMEILHPVLVSYKDSEYSLFRPAIADPNGNSPKEPDTFFLADQSFASRPFGDMIGLLRETMGTEVTLEDELIISFQDLDLVIEEDNSQNKDFSLTDIIDVFVELNLRDGENVVPALPLYLETRPRYSSRLDMLKKHLYSGGSMRTLRGQQSHFDTKNDDGDDGDEDDEENVGQTFDMHGNDTPGRVHLANNDPVAPATNTELDNEPITHGQLEQEGDDQLELDDFEKYGDGSEFNNAESGFSVGDELEQSEQDVAGLGANELPEHHVVANAITNDNVQVERGHTTDSLLKSDILQDLADEDEEKYDEEDDADSLHPSHGNEQEQIGDQSRNENDWQAQGEFDLENEQDFGAGAMPHHEQHHAVVQETFDHSLQKSQHAQTEDPSSVDRQSHAESSTSHVEVAAGTTAKDCVPSVNQTIDEVFAEDNKVISANNNYGEEPFLDLDEDNNESEQTYTEERGDPSTDLLNDGDIAYDNLDEEYSLAGDDTNLQDNDNDNDEADWSNLEATYINETADKTIAAQATGSYGLHDDEDYAGLNTSSYGLPQSLQPSPNMASLNAFEGQFDENGAYTDGNNEFSVYPETYKYVEGDEEHIVDSVEDAFEDADEYTVPITTGEKRLREEDDDEDEGEVSEDGDNSISGSKRLKPS